MLSPGERPDPWHSLVTALTGKTLGTVPIAWMDGGWTGWSSSPPDKLGDALERLLHALPFPAGCGIGTPADDLRAIRQSLLGARVAAGAAAAGQVLRSDRMGPEELLGALPAETLRAPARALLAGLRAVDDEVLVRTLAAVLDEGGAVRAASRLGVHRNTIALRLQRIRAAGFDVENPSTRLALHLATRVLLP